MDDLKPYYDEGGITIFLGDCLEVMAHLDTQSVDAIICDPPYGTTACAWDTVIPFAPMWEQLKRIIKPKGAIVLFGSQPFTSALVMSNLGMFKWEDIWEKSKPTSFLEANRKPLRAHENILVFADGMPTYNPQKWDIDQRYWDRRKVHDSVVSTDTIYGTFTSACLPDTGKRYPLSVIPINSIRAGLHPTQKPVALMAYLVKTYTNEGETVLDFTFGSGTTLVAAKHLGRKGIGIELEEKYIELAIKRLQQNVFDFEAVS